jgi:acyl-coenzyme A synthetase/AMP-(fatty) acid ligase
VSVAAFLPLPELLAVGRPGSQVVCRRERVAVDWTTFSAAATRLAAAIAVQPHARWLLACTDPLAFATALFAVLHAGRVPVIPPNFQPGTLATLGGVVDAMLADHAVTSPGVPALRMDAVGPAADPLTPLPASATLILYTSGSSGEPKAVVKQLAQLDAEIGLLERLWGSRLAGHSVAATVPHHHIYGLLFRLLWPLAAGRPFDAVTSNEPEILATRLRVLERSVLISSPAFLSRLTDLVLVGQLQPVPAMTFSSGGPLLSAAAQAIAAGWGEAPTEVYGSTETGGIAWRRQSAGDEAWTLLPGVQLETRADGTHAIRSVQAGGGAQAIADRIELLDDGRFHLRGRLDRIVKVEEKRLSLPEMEAWLENHPWVREAAATALPVPARLGAVIVLSPEGAEALRLQGEKTIAATLKDHLLARFDRVLVPKRWRFPPALPRSERGKVSAVDLADLFAGVS